jgi:hypothetical protein
MELKSTFSKVVGYKITITSIVFKILAMNTEI